MPFLNGFLVIARDTPSFVVPVLVDRPGSNLSLIQQIDIEDRIVSFLEIDVGNSYEETPRRIELQVGSPALWAFRSLHGEVQFADAISLQKSLDARLAAGEFADFPLIESQIAKFCDRFSAYTTALSKSYELVRRRSKLMAAIWRDCTVLLPLAKKDLSRTLPKHLGVELDNIRLIGMESTIRLEIPSRIHEFMGAQRNAVRLEETLAVGSAFGLDSFDFVRTEVSAASSRQVPTFEEPYGELVPFTGIGDLVAKNGPSYRRVRRFFPPWVNRNSIPAAKLPLITFCVVNTNPGTLEQALKFAKGLAEDTVRIAIVTSPITFGTGTRGHKLDLTAMGSLRPTFDYVFIVGNHVLQMPTGAAPRLAASSRAVKYVRACVEGIMEIVWASKAPRTRKEFRSIFPRDGFGLVGRAIGGKDTTPEKVLEEAVASSLNERLPLHLGKRLVVIGPPPVVDSKYVLSFLDKAADATLNETMSVVSISRRTAVTLLGFGVPPVAQSEHRHREFCLELLHARRFSILRESEFVVLGQFEKGRTAAIGFSSSEQSLSHTASRLKKTSSKTRSILTNFALGAAGVEYFWSQGIAVLHYSLLDAYLARRMTLPPRSRWQ